MPEYKVRKSKHAWYNRRCTEAKKAKDRALKRMIRRNSEVYREEYKKARNEYCRIRKEEEIKFESDIVKKCKEEPKLFYRYVNGKLKHKDGIDKLKK